MQYFLKQLDWWIIGGMILLMAVGLIAIFSVTHDTNRAIDFWKQLGFVGGAVVFVLVMPTLDYRALRASRGLLLTLYAIAIVSLAGLFVVGSTVRGSRGWYLLGFISIQPVEFVKIVMIAVLAKYFSLRNVELYRLRHIIASGVYVGIPALLVLLQPDAGSAAILVAVWVGMLLVSGIRLRAFLALLLLIVVIGGVLWMTTLKPYQKERVLSFLNPQQDPQGAGYQRRQAIVAVGSGGLFGRGIGAGPQIQSGALPEAHTDFVYAAIAEEWGYLGAIGLLAVYGMFIGRLVWHARSAPNNFARLALAGVALLFFVQFGINVAMNIGLAPVVGIPLPLVSYGGSNLLMSALAVGGAQSIIARQ